MKLFDPQDLLPSSGGLSCRDFVFVVCIIYNTKEHVQLLIENEYGEKASGESPPKPHLLPFRREAHNLGVPGQHRLPQLQPACEISITSIAILLILLD